MCDADKEQFCENSTTFTYDYPDKYHGGELSQGGYSDNIVVSERFAISIPKEADMKRIAPRFVQGSRHGRLSVSAMCRRDKKSLWQVMEVWDTWQCNIW